MAQRYQTQINLAQIGAAGQARIKAAKVLVVGVGGLGCPAALYLAAAGVGVIGLADFDDVAASNLHRQILFREKDLGRKKVTAAREHLQMIDAGVQIQCHEQGVKQDNVREVVAGYDVILDCCDNFPTRDLLNAACRRTKPLISGMALGFEGRIFTATPTSPSCWRCLYPDMPAHAVTQDCARFGVLGALTGVIGSLQALQALKWIVGAGDPGEGKLIVVDGLGTRFREVLVPADPACPACRNEGGWPEPLREISVAEWVGVPRWDVQLVDVREAAEFAAGHIDGARLLSLGTLDACSQELDPQRPVILYCQSGRRSLAAAEILTARGFVNVQSLRGGFMAYQRFKNSFDNV